MDTFVARAAALQLVQDALLSSANSEEVQKFIQDLPVLPRQHIPLEDNCPICLLPFLEVLEDEGSSGEGGVTKLEGCGHIFCRRDLVEWIRTHHLNCPTCRFQFIQINIYQDDASSDGGEYLPSSEGEEDLEADANASELADFPAEDRYVVSAADWEDEIESGPIVDPEPEGHEAMVEMWMDDYDPEYGDIGVEGGDLDFDPEYMEEGLVDSEFDPMIEDIGDHSFDPCLEEEGPDTDDFDPGLDGVIEPEFDPVAGDDPWDPFNPSEENGPWSHPVFDPAEEDGTCDPPEFDPAEIEDKVQDECFNSEFAMDEITEDVEDPGLPLEELECEPDFGSEHELDYMDGALDGLEDNYPVIESHSDSEQEELEVELGLTDGESNTSSFSEDEIQGPVLPVQPVSVQISVGDDSTGETIISHTYNSQFLK